MAEARLALGTVQFGMTYGFAQADAVRQPEAAAILQVARAAGVDVIDTASGYGASEANLGAIGVAGWRIVSKVSPIPPGVVDAAGWVRGSAERSLKRLGVSRLYGLLMHRSSDLSGPFGEAVHSSLRDLQQDGLIEKFGVSIYEPADLEPLKAVGLGLVQAPLNVLDRRLMHSGWLARLADRGVEVHARSVFLQGSLLLSPAERPKSFEPWQDTWEAWDQWVDSNAISRVQACLGFVLAQPEVRLAVVGVRTVAELTDVLACAHPPHRTPPVRLSSTDAGLINPSQWVAERRD